MSGTYTFYNVTIEEKKYSKNFYNLVLCTFRDETGTVLFQHWIPTRRIHVKSRIRYVGNEGNLIVREGYAKHVLSLHMVREPGTTPDKIYRKLVAKYHPDRNGSSTAEFMADLNQLHQTWKEHDSRR